ncbi:MAG: hypothetical protein ABSG64_06370 [Solirubrobacteraceae bacterium]|jgi:hypothetical protein
MRGRLAFLAAVLVAAVVAVAAMSSGTGSVPRNVRGTLTQMVMAMRADDGPQVCSLMTASGETFFLGLAYPKHGPCGPLATAILKRVKWTEPLAQALHGIAGATIRRQPGAGMPAEPGATARAFVVERGGGVPLARIHGHWLLTSADLALSYPLFLMAGAPCSAIPDCRNPATLSAP